MKRPSRSKEASLARKRALIRALIEQTGMNATAQGVSESGIRHAATNVEYIWEFKPAETKARPEPPSNIIPFPAPRS